MRKWLYYIGPHCKTSIIIQHVLCAISVIIAIYTRTEVGLANTFVVIMFRILSWAILSMHFLIITNSKLMLMYFQLKYLLHLYTAVF